MTINIGINTVVPRLISVFQHDNGLVNIFHNGGLVVEDQRNGHQDLQTSRYWTFGYGAISKIHIKVYAIHNNYTTLNELEEAISYEFININQEVT